MVKTISEWVQVRNCFVKKVEEKLFHVIRLEESDSNEYCIYYEHYYGVNLTDVTEETFSKFGIGGLNEFLAQKTDEEKAAYVAFHGYNYDISCNCDNEEDVTEMLKEDGVIPKKEIFKMVS